MKEIDGFSLYLTRFGLQIKPLILDLNLDFAVVFNNGIISFDMKQNHLDNKLFHYTFLSDVETQLEKKCNFCITTWSSWAGFHLGLYHTFIIYYFNHTFVDDKTFALKSYVGIRNLNFVVDGSVKGNHLSMFLIRTRWDPRSLSAKSIKIKRKLVSQHIF